MSTSTQLHFMSFSKMYVFFVRDQVHVVETIDRIDADALHWVDDVEILERVYKIKTNTVENDLDAMKRDMGAIEKYLKAQRRSTTKMATDWAKDGAAISVNQIASHIRKLSKSGPEVLFKGLETYSGLKFGLFCTSCFDRISGTFCVGGRCHGLRGCN